MERQTRFLHLLVGNKINFKCEYMGKRLHITISKLGFETDIVITDKGNLIFDHKDLGLCDMHDILTKI